MEKGVQRSLQGNTLVDLLDRVLDKGLVVAGDIVVQLADVELLTIKIRLIICSVDKAEEIGMDWWRHDRFLSSTATSAVAPKHAPVLSGSKRNQQPIAKARVGSRPKRKKRTKKSKP
jgi:hypothetical protein